MRLTVFGASGRVGGHVVRQALSAGHTVTAVVRERASFEAPEGVRTVRVPGLDAPPPVAECDAVLSAIGPRGAKDGPVATVATRGILAALKPAMRFVALSAAPAGPPPPDFLNRRLLFPFIGRVLRATYDDLRAMEALIRESGTEWTVVRPPKFVDRPLSGRYRTVIGANVPRGYTVSPPDVAHAMLAVLADPATVRQPVGVAY
ncbi:NADH-flavin reductase [Virgisporangium aliadipatigenens]|uniref:NADH-flavin reductase n=1 Tax=Virgisporangium aliadipatigenens TaxID=741659 RepID=A0A8J3YRH3_9ACTN|nr:NAD(P)H-binding protein [Virgisporangium aliadipatigenens]GIJ49038.1 NADH-flavin reductase [Virgisporangium aliadipatigenens]